VILLLLRGHGGEFDISGVNYPDGTLSDYVVFIDSLRYTDGYNEAYPDTVYSARIHTTTSTGLIINHPYYKFLGWSVWSQSTENSAINVGSDGDYVIIQNCYAIQEWSRSYGVKFDLGSQNSKIISCLILTDRGWGIWIGDDYTYIYNCTIIKFGEDTSTNPYSCIFTYSSSYPPVYVANNIAYIVIEDRTAQRLVDFHPNASTNLFDYNLYWAPYKFDNWWSYYTTNCNTIEEWRIALSVEYEGAEDHSMYANPLFLETVNYAVDETSPAWESGYDLGYGTTIGYYQGSISKPSKRKNLIMIW